MTDDGLDAIPPRQRMLALLLTLALIGSVVILAHRAWTDKYRFYADTYDSLTMERTRYSDLVGMREVLESRLATLQQGNANEGLLMAAQSANLAATTLQQRIRTVVEEHGGTLISTQVLPAGNDDGFVRVTVQAQVRIGPDTLRQMLYAVARNRPLLFLDNLRVESRLSAPRRAQDGRAGVPQVADHLAQFEITGYIKPAGGEGGT